MINIAYFANQFASKNGHGIARYSRELFEAVNRNPNSGVNLIPTAAWSDLSKLELDSLVDKDNLVILPTGRRITPLAWAYLNFPTIESIMKSKVDIVHAASLGYPIATRKPYVVTIHDIGPLSHPQFFPNNKEWIMKLSLKQAVQKADALVCVSQTTANALEDYVSKNLNQSIANRMHVVLEGVSSEFVDYQVTSNTNLPCGEQPFILAAGKLSPRKNVLEILNSLAMLKDKIPHHLLTVGGDGWDYEVVKKRVDELGLTDRVHFMGYVSDEQLKELYNRAAMFIYPSLFEGFGLTILEAMACRCPVITSNISSLPEVAGEAALLVNPQSGEEIAGAMERIIFEEGLAEDLKTKGAQRAKDLNWESCATQMITVYNSLL